MLSTLLLPLALAGGEFDAAWKLPPRSAVLFERSRRHGSGRVFDTQLAGDVTRGVAVLFRSELDDAGQKMRQPPISVNLIAPYLAFDLRFAGRRGRHVLRIPGNQAHAEIRVVVSVEPPDELGRQKIEATLRSQASESKGSRARVLRAELEVVRYFDPHAGRVLRFDSHLSGTYLRPKKETFDLRESWRLREVWTAGSRDFAQRVREAIDEGAAELHGRLARNVPGAEAKGRGRSADTWSQTGYLALTTLALQKSLRRPRSRSMDAAQTELLRRTISRTYDLTCAILALEAIYTPARERENLRTGVLKRPAERRLTPQHAERMQAWARALLGGIGDRAHYQDRAAWTYQPGNSGFDNSNTQFAVLGLYAARLCGAKVPREVFAAIARHYLAERAEREKATARLDVRTPGQLERGDEGGDTRSGPGHMRGWKYRKGSAAGRLPSGSMTAGAISSLAIARAVLEEDPRHYSDLLGRIGQAIDSGLLWIGENFSVRANPGDPHTFGRHYYWLYSLERACELSGVALLQGHDWYFEGATVLLLERKPGGGWGSEKRSAFALLFLKRAVLGPTTPRGQ